ncbi:MAG: histone deacetylase family protein [Methylophilus sp.]|nr:histone deacetylase family protein [Methylophilus sp.]
MSTAYITHSSCLKHEMGAHHPECPERVTIINDQLIASGLFDHLAHYEAPKATIEQLKRVHSIEYIEHISALSPSTGIYDIDGDTLMNPFSLDAALHAAGAVVKAVDLVMEGQASNAFCNIRPPGHHAGHAKSSGFCLFNNIAVGAAHALEQYGLERVAIVDFDVHHGDGTEDIFKDNSRVMLCSTFQHPFYPYTGADSSNDHIINVPLAAGCSGAEFRAAIIEQWLPALKSFQPQFLFISAGFDAHYEDDMGGLALKDADFLWVTETLRDFADQFCHGRIVSTLEGGYALQALKRCVIAHIKTLSQL